MPEKKVKKTKVEIRLVDGHCKAVPGVILVDPGGVIQFDKKVTGSVYIQLSGIKRRLAITAKMKSNKMTIPVSTGVGVYPYAVFCYDMKRFCTGSSMPIIIVPGERDTTSTQ